MLSSSPAPAPAARAMRVHLVTLAFTGADAALEPAFQRDYFQRSLRQVRIALALGAVMYGAYALLDRLLFPDQPELWIARFSLVCPTILLVVGASFHHTFERWMQAALALVVLGAGGGVIWMSVVAAPPTSYQYYAGLDVVLIFSYAFIRARFAWASVSGWILVAAYLIAVVHWTAIPTPVLSSNAFFLITFNMVGMAAGYGIEYATRRDFFLRQLLAAEQAQLEARVAERTAELSRVHDQLAQAAKLETVGRLAAGVAHDLNNLLTGLVTYPELLLEELPPDDPMRSDLLEIKESGLRAGAIVSDLLALSRQGTPPHEVVDLNAVARGVLDGAAGQRLLAAAPGLRVETAFEPTLLHVRGAPAQLARMVTNLVQNACAASGATGTVRIATHNRYLDHAHAGYEPIPEGEYAVLGVSDTGPGIAAADRPHLFEPFFTKKSLGRGGTGLGMTLIGAGLKEHGAYVDVIAAPGGGTTLELYFPATRELAAAPEAALPLAALRGTERVLVVDDVREQRLIATKLLTKLGYAVHAVESGEGAVEYLRRERADILLLDMVMEPGIDGCETYRRVLEIHPGQRAIGATGFATSERVAEAVRLGVGEYIQKPYTIESLARALRKELAKSAASRT